MAEITFSPIGTIHSPYKEKFAIPRQPGLIEDGGGELELIAPYNHPDCVRGLENYSHVWLLFIFHQTMDKNWRPLVRPPRLGGNAKMGVFATRSTFRPNPIGMSLVELKKVECQGNNIKLHLGSLDLVDGTPIIDIKPYLPFAESIPDAHAGFAQDAPDANMDVIFSQTAHHQIQQMHIRYPNLQRFLTQVLAQDPRPAYKKQSDDNREYAVHLLEFNVRWRVTSGITEVISLDPR